MITTSAFNSYSISATQPILHLRIQLILFVSVPSSAFHVSL